MARPPLVFGDEARQGHARKLENTELRSGPSGPTSKVEYLWFIENICSQCT